MSNKKSYLAEARKHFGMGRKVPKWRKRENCEEEMERNFQNFFAQYEGKKITLKEVFAKLEQIPEIKIFNRDLKYLTIYLCKLVGVNYMGEEIFYHISEYVAGRRDVVISWVKENKNFTVAIIRASKKITVTENSLMNCFIKINKSL